MTDEPSPGVTPLGWKGFADLVLTEGKLALTPAVRQVLEQLGVHLEVEP